jgi:SNF2 family DNA or RNA helicase
MAYWQHQKEGIEFVRDKEGALLWWGMGSGKSYTTIGICRDQKAQLTLIVCPKSVIPTWINEFEKHTDPDEFTIIAPNKKSMSVKKKAEEIKKHLEYTPDKKPKVVILNYESIWRPGTGHTYHSKNKKLIKDKGLVRSIDWDLVVLDEAQKAKSAGSKISLFLKLLAQNAKKRIALSGTPFPNSPLDAYGIYRFLDIDIFGTRFNAFRLKYAEMGGFENRQVVRYINQEDLNKKVYSIAHRIETEDVVELPDSTDIFVEVDLSPKARKLYNEFQKEMVYEFSSGTELTAANVLVKQLRLAQIASGAIRDDEDKEHIIDTAKLDALEDLIIQINEPCVVFTRFRSEVTQIRKMIEGLGKKGERPRKVYQIAAGIDERNEFAAGTEDEICVVNLQSGGTGLNELVRARYGFYFSTGYNTGDFLQSKARIKRPGSDLSKKVLYYHIMAKNTIDITIKNAIQRKINITEAVLQDFSKKSGTSIKKAA